MSRTESVLTIFLASPGDVADERNRLLETVTEWNRAWARNLGVRLEVARWEDDAYPGIGVDAQDVINRQLPQDYDLFIGIMWSRFGTPTGRAGSGTAEEFCRALQRFRSTPEDVTLFFYFKDTPVPPSKLDPTQLMKIQDFKATLKSEGVFHWEFVDTDQFEKLILLHITRHVQEWRHREPRTNLSISSADAPVPEPAKVNIHAKSVDDDDEGLLDLIEVFEERIGEVTTIIIRLNDAQSDLTVTTSQGTADLRSLAASPEGASAKHARRLIARVAEEMLQFTARTEAEIPLFRAAMNSAMTALTKAATLSVDFDSAQTASARNAAITLLSSLPPAREAMTAFKATTLALPRITKELNQAKRKQGAALEALHAELENAERLIAEAVSVIDSLIRESPRQQ